MGTMNCQNVRRAIEAADRGDLLSVAAAEHIRGCAVCEKLNDEHLKLRDIVANLGTVKAPEDFDFRLRARLAREGTAGARTGLNKFAFGFRSLAFASLMVVFAGTMLVMSLRSPQQIANMPEQPTIEAPVAAASPFQPPIGSPAGATTPVAVTADRPPRRSENSKRERTGSRDMASTRAPVVRTSDLTAHATDFPIDASPKAVKVSMDDGRGSSRTISVPTVSFGSQRVLSQSNSPLVASARGAW